MYVVYIGGYSYTSNYLSIERLSANRSKVMFNISIVSFIKGKGPKKSKSMVLDHKGGRGGLDKTTPLIVKFIHIGNIYY